MDRPDTREWLATNGLGGYASGTVCGANTRRYHGLLVAALEPPVRRTVLFSRIDESVVVSGDLYELSTSFWGSGATAPDGYTHLASFRPDPIPTWEYRVGLGKLIKRVACLPGRNATAISYRLEGGPPLRLSLRLVATCRDIHGQTHGHPDWHFRQDIRPNDVRVAAWDGAPSWHLAWSEGAEYRPGGHWFWGFRYPEEEARGLPPDEDAYYLGVLGARLGSTDRLDLLASVEPLEAWPTADDLADEALTRGRRLVVQANLPETPAATALVTAADQFLVRRAAGDGETVIAGYPWFGDWGRHTMVALPGLAITTHRFDVAERILRTFGQYVDHGMLPNFFPEGGQPPAYNAADAALWWFHALDSYTRASGDDALAREQLPLLAEVIDWHIQGTRFDIRMDPTDGLLRAGEAGVQVTWMDAIVGEHVVTPRIGKPVEINALWLNALGTMAELCERFGQPSGRYRRLADQARRGMQRFRCAAHQQLYDVIDDDGRGDPTVRPNQLIAFSLPRRAFDRQQGAAVLAAVRDHLLTPYGLRTLSPNDPAYAGWYAGDPAQRDSAYHQGSVWPWLLGPYADALLYVRGDTPETRAELRALIGPLLRHLDDDGCLGSISELFDGNAPHAARGAVAHAPAVGELLRIYSFLERPGPEPPGEEERLALRATDGPAEGPKSATETDGAAISEAERIVVGAAR